MHMAKHLSTLLRPAGDYILRFEGDGLTDLAAPPVDQLLRIVPCPKGYVTASTGDACEWV
jgi:hypothetical protein